jgi:hypothetical protein
MGVERLTEPDPAIGTAPIRRGEDLEARNVASTATNPLALLADGEPDVGVLSDHMQTFDRERVQTVP